MPEEKKFKRNIAFKQRIGDLLIGKPVMDEERFQFLELGNKKIVRVNVIGNIVDKYQLSLFSFHYGHATYIWHQ